MFVQGSKTRLGCGSSQNNCPSSDGCPKGVCPHFIIKRHDTKPAFKVSVDTCEGALDLSSEDLAVEVSIWTNSKLKKDIDNSINYFAFADNIGFEQTMVGDIIIMNRARNPEHMLVVAFDEENHLVQVQRGYNGTQATSWKKGTSFRIYRTINSPGEIEILLDDILQIDGSTEEDQIVESFLVYEWAPKDTCLSGCYWIEFKLLMLTQNEEVSMMSDSQVSIVPSFTPSTFTSSDFGCGLADGVDWIRRFPTDSDGFLIKVV